MVTQTSTIGPCKDWKNQRFAFSIAVTNRICLAQLPILSSACGNGSTDAAVFILRCIAMVTTAFSMSAAPLTYCLETLLILLSSGFLLGSCEELWRSSLISI